MPNQAIQTIAMLRLIFSLSAKIMKNENAEKRFEEYRENLKAEIIRLSSFMKLYRRLHERQADRLAVMNIAQCFFTTTKDSLFSVIILWVDKLLIQKSGRGFWNFLAFIEKNRKIFDISELQKRRDFPDGHWALERDPITFDTIEVDRAKIMNLKSLKSFKKRRDKFHAHFDKEYFFDRKRIRQDAPLKWDDMDEVFELMGGILNKYSSAYDGNIYHLVPTNVHDVDRILDALHKSASR